MKSKDSVVNIKVTESIKIKKNIHKKVINKCNYKLVFDTETTGFPQKKGFDLYYPPSQTYRYNNARLVELAYIIYDADGNVIKKVESLIKPNGFVILNSNIHGITTDKAMLEGNKLRDVLTQFNEDLQTVDTLIAHNIDFDINVVLAECYRTNQKKLIAELTKKDQICTMRLGKCHLKQVKYPKLSELYSCLFNKEWKQTHRALDDAKTCGECYFQITK
jgi:DNA polymerase-3 subunit epsilon